MCHDVHASLVGMLGMLVGIHSGYAGENVSRMEVAPAYYTGERSMLVCVCAYVRQRKRHSKRKSTCVCACVYISTEQ